MADVPDPVFLTGGSGLVGSHVAEWLRYRGAEVVALQRRDSAVEHLEDLGCRIAAGDLTDPEDALSAALDGCRSVVHAAALVYSGDDWSRLEAVNVQGTARLARASASQGIRRFVHLSSVAAYGDKSGLVSDAAALDGTLGPKDLYARSKRLGEAALLEVASPNELPTTILRPAVVFGERDRQFTLTLARLARMRIIPMLGGGNTTLPVVYAANLASAVARALVSESTGTFNVSEDQPTTQRDLVLGLARALRRSPRVINLPGGWVRGAGRLAEVLGVRPRNAPDLSLERAARLWTLGNPYVTEGVRTILGWRPEVSRESALQRTADWLTVTENQTPRLGH